MKPPKQQRAPTRGMIVGRSLAASAMNLIPIPILDELLAGAVRATLLARIAETRRIDASEQAIAELADVSSGALLHLAIDAATAAALFRHAYRRLARGLRVMRRLDQMTATFSVATLFDHYCAHHHVGPGLDEASGRVLRGVIDGAIGDARRGIAGRVWKSATRGTARLFLAAPRAVGRFIESRRGERPQIAAEAIPPSEAVVVTARGGRGLALFGDLADAWTAELTRAFDRRWATRKGETS